MLSLFAVLLSTAPSVARAATTNAHFGLSELHTTIDNQDSLVVNPLGASWTWHNVYPRNAASWRNNCDNLVNITQQLGLELVVSLWSAVTYSSKSYMPTDTTAWKDSVTAIVERYDGDGYLDYPKLTIPVKYWHVEEELSFWGNTWGEYVKYLGMTRRAIRKADTSAKVICAGLDSNQLWGCGYNNGFIEMPPSAILNYGQAALDRYAAKIDTVLGGGFYDIVDMHSYEQASIIKGKCDYVRSLMYNPSLPIWCIEAGGPYYTRAQGYTDTLNAQMVVRQIAEAFGVGVERYSIITFQYGLNTNFNIEPWTNMPLTRGQTVFTLKPSYQSYAQMTQKIGGWTSATDLTARTSTEDRDIFQIRFIKDGAPVDIYWCDRDTTFLAPVTQPFAKITHIIDVPGVTPLTARVEYIPANGGVAAIAVGPDPIYVESSSTGGIVGVVKRETLIDGRVAGLMLRAGPAPAAREARILWGGLAAIRESPLLIRVFTTAGRPVRSFALTADEASHGSLLWDLQDERGWRVPDGVYIVEAHAAGARGSARIVVVK